MTFKQGGAGVRRWTPAIAGVFLFSAASSVWAAPAGHDVLPGIIPGATSGLTVK